MLRPHAKQLLALIILALFAGTATADYPLRPVPFNEGRDDQRLLAASAGDPAEDAGAICI